MDSSYSHIFWYATGNYKWSDDVVDDLKTLIAHRCGGEKKFIQDRDVFAVVLNAYESACFSKLLDFNTLRDILSKIDPSSMVNSGEDSPKYLECLCRAILAKISILPIRDKHGATIINLLPIDDDILPLSDDFSI